MTSKPNNPNSPWGNFTPKLKTGSEIENEVARKYAAKRLARVDALRTKKPIRKGNLAKS